MQSHHERLTRDARIPRASERVFGIVLGAAFAAAALKPLLHGGRIRIWAAAASVVLLFLAAVRPGWLSAPNRLWSAAAYRIGLAINSILLFLLFYLVFVPAGVLLRCFRKDDPLRLAFEKELPTYWVERKPPGPEPCSMKNQF